jgi:hypothetical protein
MAIAPIVGKFRRRLIFDLTGSIGGGMVMGYWFWYVTLDICGTFPTS